MPHCAFKAAEGEVSRARGNGPGGRAALIAPDGTAAIVRRFRAGFSASRRGGRVAEGARLESVWAGNRLVGSNPTPSATLMRYVFVLHGYWKAVGYTTHILALKIMRSWADYFG